MAKKRRKTDEYDQANFFMIATVCMLLMYLYLLVGLYPFLIEPGYEVTSHVKFGFLAAISYGFSAGPLWVPTFIPLSVLCIIIGTVLYIRSTGKGVKDFLRSTRFSATDIFMAAYGLFVITATILTPYRNELFWGYPMWYMGYATQFMFIITYFITSRFFDMEDLKGLVYASLLASAAVFAIGILQRFGYDIFGLYNGLENKLFISTIGQHTYFSSYMILFYMLGAFAYWISEAGSAMHRAAAVHLVIGSCLPCILNADMIFSGMFFALSFLFVMSFDSIERMKAFFEIALIIVVTWRIIGIIWYLAEPEFRLEPMPQYIMQSPWIWIAVAGLAAVYLFIRKKAGERVRVDMAKYRYLGIIYTGLVALAIGLVMVYIILNTKEILPESLRSHANYLLFDAQWGNGRGAIWHDTLASLSEEFKKAPVTAIFGVGPDQYFNIIDEYVNDWLVQYSDKVAMSAHNEWLNAFVNFGMFGGAAYLGIFISALIRFVKIRSKAPVALGAAVIVVAYLAHQMFGYQQFASTPYIFLVLGIGECAARRADPEQGKMNRD